MSKDNEQLDDHKLVATKVSIPTWRKFNRVLRKIGMSSYEAVQNFVDVFIRFGDDKHNLTPDMELLMSSFEKQEKWGDTFNLADPTTQSEISEATYYLRDKDKKGVRVCHVERPFFGDWSETWNVKQILEKFLCLTFPSLYSRLRAIAVARECMSILELLYNVVSEMESEENKAEFRKPFEDAERSEWGKTPHTQPYKIHHRKMVDDMPSPTLFDNYNFIENEHEDSDDDDLDFDDQIIKP